MEYVLRFKDLSYPVKNDFCTYEKSHTRVKIFKGQKKLLKDCYDNHITPLPIDVKLKNSTEFFPPARKLILEDHIKTTKNELEDAHHHLRGTSRSFREQCLPLQLDVLRNVAKSPAKCIAASHAVISLRKNEN